MPLLPDLFHIAVEAEWAAGDYRGSTRGASYDQIGFVHCSFAWQVAGVLDAFYRDVEEPLVLLRLASEGLPVRVAPVGGTHFPHVLVPLTSALEVLALHRDGGRWQLPTLLADQN